LISYLTYVVVLGLKKLNIVIFGTGGALISGTGL
jgi:hypothetical protein